MAKKELTPEERAAINEKRRAYYHGPRHDEIRKRDNESARRNREKDPTRYKEYYLRFKKNHREKQKDENDVSVQTTENPDKEKILSAIKRELFENTESVQP